MEDETPEEKDARKSARNAKLRAKRAAEKAAKLANTQNSGLAEFQELQTVPRSLAITQGSKGLSQEAKSPRHQRGSKLIQNSSIRLPCRNDETLVENSEMETLPLIVRKRKPIDFTMADLEAEKSDEDSDGYVAKVSPTKSRKLPKRKCTIQIHHDDANDSSSDDRDDFEMYLDDLVESTVANVETEQDVTRLVVASVLESLIASVIKPKTGMYKRKFSLGRKSKGAKKSKDYRATETAEQYKKRLEKSAKYNQNLPESKIEKRNHVRRLKR